MDEPFLVGTIIAALAIVQSVFGVGLLVFGTPTLLLLGLDFPEALGLLLPASIAISAIQTASDPTRVATIWRSGRPLLSIGPLIVSLAAVLALGLQARVDVLIGLTLVAAAAIRHDDSLRRRISRLIVSGERPYLMAMGAVHGLTNMGGALLTLYAAAHQDDKHGIRGTIATYYLMFAVAQVATLVIMRPDVLGWRSLLAVIIAAFGYWLCGRIVFMRATPRVYDRAVTGFIAAYGAAVLVKSML
ncbi:hypothetical protein N825_08465 [Skermanella stibiiresistens SB22]|uniref:Probable membrane transporter protein n=1 Tax=Skermanella stibiiresistens SB22 TaxID=1385369 RepID=W9GYL2_9PROT|nr:TSUP family transporter [Skermanella stibiiresistens]EWY39025.1 hypothetical protein N825_08465 [Skermanella stibiiresistens SB22]